MKFGIATLDDFELRGKVVICRVDINSPLDPATGGLRDTTRIRGCTPTVRELSEAGARVVLLAHQGGDLEYQNYASTEPHAAKLAEYLGRQVLFIDDVVGPAARAAIAALADGEILLLDNVRFVAE
jgi:phosphoglycerate kinase